MLHYDVNFGELLQVADELKASKKQVRFALSRAMRRTTASLRKQASKGLARELQLRSVTALRRRLKTISLRMNTSSDDQAMGLWFGLNPLPVSAFKGRPRQTPTGATFKGEQFPGAFVARSKVKGKQTIFKRKGNGRLPLIEQSVPIEDDAMVFIEDQVFDQVLDLFWKNFRRDLQARVKFNIGEA